MSKALKVDLSRKCLRFPKDIKEAHDQVLPRFNKAIHAAEDKKFRQAVKKLYAGMQGFSKDGLCIVMPMSRSDLISEGQSLKHCVGGDYYAKNHIAGTQMIFFIRKANEPKKPYFTLEVDMKAYTIRQLHGYANRTPPKDDEVSKFANEFLRQLKRAGKEKVA
jgi:hypothetical protein